MAQPTLRTVWAELKSQNLLPLHVHQEQIADTLTTLAQKPPTPWFISVLVGISAWLAIIPFIVFFAFFLEIIDSSKSAMLVGVLLVATTFFLHYFKRDSLFLNQLALALNLTGQALFIGGIVGERDLATAALATWFLEIVVIAIYQDNILRFLSVLLATVAALVLLYEFDIHQAIHVLIVLIATGAVWYWIAEASHLTDNMMATLYRPLGYGFVVAMQMLLILSILPAFDFIPDLNWEYSTFGLTTLLLALEYYILRTNNIQLFSATSFAVLLSTILIALLLHQAPGIIASVIIIALGFQRGNRVLMGLAFIFLSVFFVAYYYHLDISLLMKSITLASAGVTLLVLRLIFKQVFPLGEQL